jgi:ribosomal protein S18 acetylase RimI-like enzyme
MSWSSTVSFLYATEPGLAPHDFIDVLRRSTLAERRPVNEPATIAGMMTHADIILTVRTQLGLLVGVSRAITDYHYCTYLSDLAVDVDYQRQGIGRELIRLTHEAAGLRTRLILLSAPAAQNYYPRIGLRPHDSCWTIDPKRDVTPPACPPVDHPLRPT